MMGLVFLLTVALPIVGTYWYFIQIKLPSLYVVGQKERIVPLIINLVCAAILAGVGWVWALSLGGVLISDIRQQTLAAFVAAACCRVDSGAGT